MDDDPTKLERAERALASATRQWGAILDVITDAVCLTDLDGTVVRCNVAFETLVGRAGDAVRGANCCDLVHGAGGHPDPCPLPGMLAAHAHREAEYRIAGRWLWAAADPVFGETGELIGAVQSFADIGRRKGAEQALRESEEMFRTTVEGLSEGLVLIDEDGLVLEWNPAIERIDGIKREDAIGRPVWDVEWQVYLPERKTPEHYQYVKQSVIEAVRDGVLPTIPHEIGIRARDGTSRTVRQSIFRIRTDRGYRIGTVISDVTDRKLAEAERTALEAQLLQSQKMLAVGQLAGGVAHDFNNVLQAILSLSQAMGGQLDDPERFRATVVELQEQVMRGAALTRQLLLFSRSDPPRLARLDLNDVVRRSSRMMQRLLRENIALELDLAAAPIPLEGDGTHLEQVLMNLVVNAADAMPHGGRLTVRTGVADGIATLEIGDTGTGMDAEVQARIFEPFFTTKEASKGTGLGLAVVHGIVAAHGGRIQVASEVGRGSTFTVLLPVAPAPSASAPVPEATPGPALAVGGGERLLVVEDEAGAREGLVQVLTMLGYRVTPVGSGTEAAALPAQPGFDLLLTDYMLPDTVGTDLAATLQRRWPGMRVVLMSGYAEEEALRRRIAAGDLPFLQKPFGMETLSRILRAALGGRPASATA